MSLKLTQNYTQPLSLSLSPEPNSISLLAQTKPYFQTQTLSPILRFVPKIPLPSLRFALRRFHSETLSLPLSFFSLKRIVFNIEREYTGGGY